MTSSVLATQTIEDSMILECSDNIYQSYLDIFDQIEQKLSYLLSSNKDLTKLSSSQNEELIGISTQYKYLLCEQITDNNPYEVYALAKRFTDDYSDIISQIHKIRDSEYSNSAEKTADLRKQLQILKDKLKKNEETTKQDIKDISNRDIVLQQLNKIYKDKGLLETVNINFYDTSSEHTGDSTGDVDSDSSPGKKTKKLLKLDSNNIETVSHVMILSEYSASLIRALLLLTHHIGVLSGSLPIVTGAITTIAALVALLSSGSEPFTLHKSINLTVSIAAAFMSVVSSALMATKDFLPEVSSQLSWSPVFGATAGWLVLALETGNVIVEHIKYNKNIKKLNENFADSEGWLEKNKKLSKEQQQLKEVLLNKISLDIVNDNPQSIKSIFTKNEFEEYVKPSLIEHAKDIKDKRIAKHVFNIGVLLVILTMSIAIFVAPQLGAILALIIVSFALSSFTVKISLYYTVLKEKEFARITDFKVECSKNEDPKSLAEIKDSSNIASSFVKGFNDAIGLVFVNSKYKKDDDKEDMIKSDSPVIFSAGPSKLISQDTGDGWKDKENKTYDHHKEPIPSTEKKKDPKIDR